MTWLLFSFFVFLFTFLGQERVGKNYAPLYRIFLVMFLSYMIGFGGQLCTDHDNYSLFYKNFDGLSEYNILNLLGKNGRFEFGFMLLAQISHWLGLGAPGFLFVVSFITNTLMVSVLYRFKYPLLSMLMFITTAYYSQQANGVRQMLAVAVFLYSIQYLVTRQTIKYLICILVASMFHFGAIILVLFAFLRYVNIEKHFNAITKGLIGMWLLSILGVIGIFRLGAIIPMGIFSVYDDFAEQTGDYDSNFNPIYNLILLLGLLYYRKEHKIYLIIYAIGCILLNLSMASEFGKSLYRFAYYFTPFFCLFTAELLFYKNYSLSCRYVKPLLTLVCLYYSYRLLFLYILNPDIFLGGAFYPLSDFFA